jgi:membrane fusion protein (multidrug efflux system)
MRYLKPLIKTTLWTVCVLAVVSALAAPKVMPMLHASDAKQADAGEKGDAAKKPKEKAAAAKDRAPLRVSAIVVHTTPFAEAVTSTGTLIAEEGVELQAETNGKVVSIGFTEGARVKKGDLLVRLNDADLIATYSRAKYRKELATLREKRIAQLLKQGVARQEEYDTALNELNVQDAEIALTEAQIAKTEIRAPFDGVVGLRYVSEGSFVNAQTRIATLQRLDRLKVDFAIPEKYAGRIHVGAPIAFTIVGGEKKFGGQIYAFDPRIDTSTRTLLIRAVVPNPDGRLLPGAFASVEVTLGQLKEAVLIPAVAVVPGLNEKNVYVVKDGKAERRAVETGTRLESTVHILSGLAAGETVVTSGLQQIRSGQSVSIIGETST